MFSMLRRLLAGDQERTPKYTPLRRFQVELLEDRTVPATYTVTNLADGGAGSLRQAVLDSNAHPGDNYVQFASGLKGTINLTSGEIPITTQLVVNGPGAGVLTVSANNQSRIFTTSAAKGMEIDVIGLTLTNGQAYVGGAIHNLDGNLVVENSVITSNTATLGGAVAADGVGSVSLSYDQITNNVAANSGGGVYAQGGGSVSLQDVTVANNSAQALAASTASATPAGANVPHSGGGGLAINGSALSVTQSTIANNISSGEGGGVALVAGPSASIVDSTFSDNTSTGNGGGGAISSRSAVTIANSTIAGNLESGGSGGGGVSVLSGGGAILQSTIVAHNLSTSKAADIHGAIASSGNNLIGVSTGGSGYVASDILDKDASLGTLASNGGTTQTRLLLSDSPAIGAGANTQGLILDQRGYPRSPGGKIDIGAVSYDSVAPTAQLTAAPDVNAASSPSQYLFTVTYTDDQVIRLDTIRGGEISVTGPNGYNVLATPVGVDQQTDGTPRTVTYQIVPPKTSWLPADNGVYTISSVGGQVTDGQGNAVAAGVLGTFTVNVTQGAGYVQQLYQTVLGRNADSAGLQHYEDQLKSGVSRADVARSIWQSDEHRVQQIDQYYQTFLGRSSDETGRNGYLQMFHNGASESDVIGAILSSQEYITLRASNNSFVIGVYESVLGRTADQAGGQTYIDQLSAKPGSYSAVVQSVLAGQESKQNYVDFFFSRFLRRSADQATTQNYVDAMNGGKTISDVAINILASDEFYKLSGSKS